MSHKFWISIALILFLLAALLLAQPVNASQSSQQAVYQTPTALPDGRVIYVVQKNDTCGRIQLLTGVTVNQLITLNKLDKDCTLSIGKELILAIITPTPSPTPNPLFTATPLLPTPTPFKGSGKVCIQLYNDANGNGFEEESEALIAGGVASISDASGKISKTGNTSEDAEKPFCQDVPEGQYNISMAVPDGYNATTATSLLVAVQAGNTGYVNFGAQVSSKAAAENVVSASSTTAAPSNPNGLLMAILGGLLLLAGIGLGVYVLVMKR